MQADLQGMEFDWFAVDCNGNIALFATAGEGFVPEVVIACFEKHSNISESLPTQRHGTSDVWLDYAEAGLFVFDWVLHGGPYKRCAIPTKPLSQELKKKIRSVPDLPKFNGSFVHAQKISAWL